MGVRRYVVYYGIGGEFATEFCDAHDALDFASGLTEMTRPPGWIDPCIEEILVGPADPGEFADIG